MRVKNRDNLVICVSIGHVKSATIRLVPCGDWISFFTIYIFSIFLIRRALSANGALENSAHTFDGQFFV